MHGLRSTIAVLGSSHEAEVPDSLRVMVAHTEGGRAEALSIARLPHKTLAGPPAASWC